MSAHKPLYRHSLRDALEHNERDDWRESYKENCDCARAIERAISEHYKDNRLEDCASEIIDRYGFDRVNWVLANTIKQKDHDGRFSEANKAWAKKLYIPNDDVRWHFCAESHPVLTNAFVDQARKAWQDLGLFDASHCLPNDSEQDYRGKVVVIDPSIFKDEYKKPDCQLFLAEGGFGASPHARGRKVFGKFLDTGESTQYNRSDIIGVLKDECLPEWAADKLEELQPNKNEDITMGGR